MTEILITIVDAFDILNNDIKTLPLCTRNKKKTHKFPRLNEEAEKKLPQNHLNALNRVPPLGHTKRDVTNGHFNVPLWL